MNKIIIIICSILLVTSCAAPLRNSGELVGVGGGIAWNEPTPLGMVLVKGGSLQFGNAKEDSVWGVEANATAISVDAFWMDETEISNAKYRQFVYWVRDSIIRERLADPAFGGNEAFKIEEDKQGNPIKPYLNWNRPIPWKNATEDELRAINSVYRINPITGKKELDAAQMNYRYEIFDHTTAALRQNRLDASRRNLNTDIKISEEPIIISKDTAYIDDNGKIINISITRPLQSEYDFLHTRIVNIYPDTTSWINDFDNAYMEPYMRLYFSHPSYDNYPVVGVSWEQATAFCSWRTNLLISSIGNRGNIYIEPYRLPSEAEWEYAARAGQSENIFPWQGEAPNGSKGCYYANFKPEKGNYIQDGNLISAVVGSYTPNLFGLYDMAGNISEWTSSAYAESANIKGSDLNPNFKYDAAQEDPYKLKRKIIRGGSWKDPANFIRADRRLWEYQNEQRSYVGFRCVRTQVGIRTRR